VKCQKSAWKDLEHCFRVLQARFQVVANPTKQWDKEVIINVFIACMVFHYMMNDNEVIENLELAWQDQKII
jgi:hypothetical protein